MTAQDEAYAATETALLKWINGNSSIKGLLYDTDMRPRQLERGSPEWINMLRIVLTLKAQADEIAALRSTLNECCKIVGDAK